MRLVITPADETMRSPCTYLRYFLGTTGTGLAPPKANRPPDANHSNAGIRIVIHGSMCGSGLSVTRPSM